ncbi:kanadaptin [Sergentomyia squamirostris]
MEEEFKVPSLDIKRPVKPPLKKADKEEEKSDVPKVSEEEGPSSAEEKPGVPAIECPYVEPKWSGKPPDEENFSFEVLKTGTIIEVVENLENKAFWIFGRLPQCDIPMAHPTISRYHAVLQYRPEDEKSTEDSEENEEMPKKKKPEPGWYLYDLTSTHGTFINKQRVPPKTYIRVRVGHIIKLGGSTRQFILQGPAGDEEKESELSVTELRELKKQQAIEELKRQEERRQEEQRREKAREDQGISWGMGDDAEEEEVDLSVNPFAATNNEQLFLDDPKKTLRGFFEREGLTLEYKVEEMSQGTFVCRVELPIDDAQGRPLVAEVCHKGKKKECVVQCALEACRMLDRHGVLRQANHEPLRKRVHKSDSDDDDDFLDRTGDVQRRRQRKTASGSSTALSYDDLLEQKRTLNAQIDEVDQKIEQFKDSERAAKESAENEDEDLDDFMTNLRPEKSIDKIEIKRLRMEQQRLRNELSRVEKLAKIAAPHLPSIKSLSDAAETSEKKKPVLPLFGKRTRLKNDFGVKREERKVNPETEDDGKEEVEEEFNEKPKKLKETELENPENLQSSVQEPAPQPIKIIPAIPANKSHSRVLGPTIDPELLKRIIQPEQEPSIPDTSGVKNKLPDQEVDEDDKSEQNVNKRRKIRIRNREKGRDNIDMPDEDMEEDVEKFSGWLPPENQRGDGMTELNKKLGY